MPVSTSSMPAAQVPATVACVDTGLGAGESATGLGVGAALVAAGAAEPRTEAGLKPQHASPAVMRAATAAVKNSLITPVLLS
jgi:hypothetical protein